MKTMKFLVAALMLSITGNAVAQSSTVERMKQRKELQKANRDLQKSKIAKETRKLAKSFEKEGWKVMPGVLSIVQQQERATLYQNQFEEDLLTPQYVWGDATSTGENYDGAKFQAIELAQLNLIDNLEKNITKIVENNRANKQLTAGDAATVVKTLEASKSIVSQKLGQTTTVVDMYRLLANGNVEVRVQIYYSMDKARNIAKEAIREQLEKEGKQLGGQLDKLMDK